MKKKIYEAPTTIVFVTTLQNILAGSTGGGTSQTGEDPDGTIGKGEDPDPNNPPLVEAKPNTHPWSEWDD